MKQKYSSIIITAACLVVAGHSLNLFAQGRPKPIATTRVGDRILELHAIEKTENIKPIGEQTLPFVKKELMTKLNAELGIEKWESTQIGIGDRYVLGLLLVNGDGSLPAAKITTCTAFRSTMQDGSPCCNWPHNIESPVQELSNHEWPLKLTPMPIEVSKGTKELKNFEGVLLRTPSRIGQITFSKKELTEQAIAWDSGVFVFPLEMRRANDMVRITFAMFTEKPFQAEEKSNVPKSTLDMLAATIPTSWVEYQIQTSKQAPAKTANFTAAFTPNAKVSKDILNEIRKLLKELIKENTLKETDISFMLSGNRLTLTGTEVGFAKVADFTEVQVNFAIPDSGPIAERFFFDSIPLAPAGKPQEINEMVAQLKVETRPSSNTEPTNKGNDVVRTWSDNSGKFNIEAKLIEETDDAVKLEKADGKQITVAKSKLSSKDLQFLNQQKGR